MDDALWSRLSDQVRREVDRLLGLGRLIQAAVLIRDSVDAPPPSLRECVDLLRLRSAELGRPLA